MPGNKRTERSCLEQIFKYLFLLINLFHLPVAIVFHTDQGLKTIGSRKLRNKLRREISNDMDSFMQAVNEDLQGMTSARNSGTEYQPQPMIPIRGRSEAFRRLPFPVQYLNLEELRPIVGKSIIAITRGLLIGSD